jgi:hypothetical protein
MLPGLEDKNYCNENIEITYNRRGGSIRSVCIRIISDLPIEKWRVLFAPTNGRVIVRETLFSCMKPVYWIPLFIHNYHLSFRFCHFIIKIIIIT